MAARTGDPVFVIPHYARSEESWSVLHRTLETLAAQDDEAWQAVVVDDASPLPDTAERLAALCDLVGDRLEVLSRDVNGGPGACRNTGVRWAGDRGAPFVLFLDADDLAHPSRLSRTRRLFASRPDADFVYSGFTVVDEQGEEVPEERITPSIREILDSHRKGPLEGPDAWVSIGTELGYTTLTSTVSVRTELALRFPFPATYAAEDDHAWLRMSAGGSAFAFLADTHAGYRVPTSVAGSATRQAMGSGFYWASAQVTADGFARALSIALARGTVSETRVEPLLARFYERLAETMEGEGHDDIAQVMRALTLN